MHPNEVPRQTFSQFHQRDPYFKQAIIYSVILGIGLWIIVALINIMYVLLLPVTLVIGALIVRRYFNFKFRRDFDKLNLNEYINYTNWNIITNPVNLNHPFLHDITVINQNVCVLMAIHQPITDNDRIYMQPYLDTIIHAANQTPNQYQNILIFPINLVDTDPETATPIETIPIPDN